MCRLFALTATLPEQVIVPLVDRAMLLMMSEFQRDGWGISFQNRTWKTAGPYGAYCQWMKEIHSGDLVIGHVRNASVGTSITVREAQPFTFEHFIGAHNGWFDDWKYGHVADVPNSDSYRAFARLNTILSRRELSEDDLVDPLEINAWLSNYFYNQTTFACMLLRKKHLYVLRNKDRMLYCSRIGRGYLLCTSPHVLSMLIKFMKDCFDLEISKPKLLLSDHLYDFQVDRRIRSAPLEYQFLRFWQGRKEEVPV